MEEFSKNLSELARNVGRLLVCPRCFASFDSSSIEIKGFVNEKLIIETVCQNSHPPVKSIFVAQVTSDGRALSGIRAIQPISDEDVKKLRVALQNFDGNFKRIFSNERKSKS